MHTRTNRPLARIVVALSMALMTGALSTSAAAQAPSGAPKPPTEQSDTSMQRRCQAAAAALDGVAPETTADTLREQISVCEVNGPAIIAQQWAAIAGPSRALADLIDASRYIRDERIFQALQGVAQNQSRVDAVRIAAMNVLASYALPKVARWPLRMTDVGPVVDYQPEQDTITGPQPVVGNVAGRVDGTLEQVFGGGATSVRPSRPARQGMTARATDVAALPTNALDYAFQLQLALREQIRIEKFPVTSANITLTYMCGNKFRVRNKTPFDPAMTYDVYNSGNPPRDVRLLRASGNGDYTEAFFVAPVAGTVRLFYGTDLVQTKANGGTVCPP